MTIVSRLTTRRSLPAATNSAYATFDPVTAWGTNLSWDPATEYPAANSTTWGPYLNQALAARTKSFTINPNRVPMRVIAALWRPSDGVVPPLAIENAREWARYVFSETAEGMASYGFGVETDFVPNWDLTTVADVTSTTFTWQQVYDGKDNGVGVGKIAKDIRTQVGSPTSLESHIVCRASMGLPYDYTSPPYNYATTDINNWKKNKTADLTGDGAWQKIFYAMGTTSAAVFSMGSARWWPTDYEPTKNMTVTTLDWNIDDGAGRPVTRVVGGPAWESAYEIRRLMMHEFLHSCQLPYHHKQDVNDPQLTYLGGTGVGPHRMTGWDAIAVYGAPLWTRNGVPQGGANPTDGALYPQTAGTTIDSIVRTGPTTWQAHGKVALKVWKFAPYQPADKNVPIYGMGFRVEHPDGSDGQYKTRIHLCEVNQDAGTWTCTIVEDRTFASYGRLYFAHDGGTTEFTQPLQMLPT